MMSEDAKNVRSKISPVNQALIKQQHILNEKKQFIIINKVTVKTS